MTELRHRMIADMKLHGLAPGTPKVYVNAVSRLAGYFHRSSDQLSKQDLREYLTYLVETKKVPSSTLRAEIFGVKFLFDNPHSPSVITLLHPTSPRAHLGAEQKLQVEPQL